MQPRTFTVTHIQRPFMTTKDSYEFKLFRRRIDFYSVNENNEMLLHWQDINIQSQEKEAFQKLLTEKMVIELPEPIQIPEGKCLWMYLGSSLYIADAKEPSENDMQQVCSLASCWERVPGRSIKDDRQHMDVVVIRHLLTPAEGYPTELGVLRAMTFVTTTLTEDIEKNYHFGPKNYYVRDRETKWEKWKEEGRIIDLEKPILYKPKDQEISGFIKGEEGFWTDSTKTHHFGIVPQEAKCFFITHVLTFGRRPKRGSIERRTPYAGYYYIFDVGQTEHGYGDGSLSHQFATDIVDFDEKVIKGEFVKIPIPFRAVRNMQQTWIDSNGNVFAGHGTEPNTNPYKLLMHSSVIASLPESKDSSDRYVDFETQATNA